MAQQEIRLITGEVVQTVDVNGVNLDGDEGHAFIVPPAPQGYGSLEEFLRAGYEVRVRLVGGQWTQQED